MLLRIDRIHQSQPMGGWGYAFVNGPILSDKTVDGLVVKMQTYFKANGMHVVDMEDLIANKYSGTHPWLIKTIDDKDLLFNDAEEFINKAWRSFPLQLAEARTREDRFVHCEKCKYFEKLETDDLSEETARRLLCLNPAKHRKEHGWCILRGWVCSIAVQIHAPAILAADKDKHSDCWL